MSVAVATVLLLVRLASVELFCCDVFLFLSLVDDKYPEFFVEADFVDRFYFNR